MPWRRRLHRCSCAVSASILFVLTGFLWACRWTRVWLLLLSGFQHRCALRLVFTTGGCCGHLLFFSSLYSSVAVRAGLGGSLHLSWGAASAQTAAQKHVECCFERNVCVLKMLVRAHSETCASCFLGGAFQHRCAVSQRLSKRLKANRRVLMELSCSLGTYEPVIASVVKARPHLRSNSVSCI